MTLPLDDLVRRVHAQLLAASGDIEDERDEVPGRSMALTEVDLEVPVGFLAEPVDPTSISEDPPEVLVTFEEGDGRVSLSFRPRPRPDSGNDAGPDGDGRGSRDGDRGEPDAGSGSGVGDPDEAADADATPGRGRGDTGGGSAVEELIALGARPRTARLLARHGPPVEDIASAGVHELRTALDEALREGDDGAPTAGDRGATEAVPDVRELSRIVAAAAERET